MVAKWGNRPVVCRMLVHIFGAQSSPTCANFALKLKAADLPSRGLMDKPIDCLNFWLKGPQFL